MRRAIYAGSFDPITNGHLWVIEQGAKLFDELYIAIGINPKKKYEFTEEERSDMIERSTPHVENKKIVTIGKKYTVEYARQVDANYILRGVRSVADLETERDMRHMNSDINPDIETIFLMPPRNLAEVSSSAVKSLLGYDNWQEAVAMYVPEPVLEKFIERYQK